MFGCLINYFLTIVNGELSRKAMVTAYFTVLSHAYGMVEDFHSKSSVMIMGCNWE